MTAGIGLSLTVILASWCHATTPGQIEFFEKNIRPVLVERCYECHSATSKKLKGGLRLDSKAGFLRGGETGPAIVPSHAEKSLLIECVEYGNRDLQMPPKERLPDAIIENLKKWVNDGAADPRDEEPSLKLTGVDNQGKAHWAFQPIRDPALPPLDNPITQKTNPIDQFVAAKLRERGLHPSPEAARRILIRRATYDLTGLPPTPGEIDAFLKDTSTNAFEQMIDRLLASPRYGERWGRWWLDVARYADTNGVDENKVMANAWRYRDWVIRAMNNNKSFDDFITEQLAGDLLPTDGLREQEIFDRWIATGFLVLGPKLLAEQDKTKMAMDIVDEQIDVVSRAFLGLTVTCARCHDHKFDPVSTRDYYALAGIFRSTKTMENLDFVSKFNERRITDAEHLAAIHSHEKLMEDKNREIKEAISRANKELAVEWRAMLPNCLALTISTENPPADDPLLNKLVEGLRNLLSQDNATNNVSRTLRRLASEPDLLAAFLQNEKSGLEAANGVLLAPGRIGAAFLADGHNHLEMPSAPELEPQQLTIEAWVRVGELSKDKEQRCWIVGKNGDENTAGHFALAHGRERLGALLNIAGGKDNLFEVWSRKMDLSTAQWHHVAMTFDGSVMKLFVDGQFADATDVGKQRTAGSGPLVLGQKPDGSASFKGLVDEVHLYKRSLGADQLKAHFTNPGTAENEDVVARWEFNELSDTQREGLALIETYDALFAHGGCFHPPDEPRQYYPSSTKEVIVDLESARDALEKTRPAPASFTLAVEENKIRDLPVHIRGNHLNLEKETVPRGFVQVLCSNETPKVAKEQSGRLELARWLTSHDQPLTARVIVNRVWQAHFGEGIVRTPDNFGVRGETPSHPELLDWLASEFMRSGWNLKQLHRLIMTSAAWRQAGRGTFGDCKRETGVCFTGARLRHSGAL